MGIKPEQKYKSAMRDGLTSAIKNREHELWRYRKVCFANGLVSVYFPQCFAEEEF